MPNRPPATELEWTGGKKTPQWEQMGTFSPFTLARRSNSGAFLHYAVFGCPGTNHLTNGPHIVDRS
jgi:hypothetical protein